MTKYSEHPTWIMLEQAKARVVAFEKDIKPFVKSVMEAHEIALVLDQVKQSLHNIQLEVEVQICEERI